MKNKFCYSFIFVLLVLSAISLCGCGDATPKQSPMNDKEILNTPFSIQSQISLVTRRSDIKDQYGKSE